MSHYPDLDSAFDWLKQIFLVAGPIGSTTQIWIVACHQYGIGARRSSDFISRASRNACWVFSQTSTNVNGNLISKKPINFFTCLKYKTRKNLNCEIQLFSGICICFLPFAIHLALFVNPLTGMDGTHKSHTNFVPLETNLFNKTE